MRCLVIGCGSIGTRRARLLAEMGHDVVGVDTDPGRVEALSAYGVESAEYGDGMDVALICTPVGVRLDPIRYAIAAGVRGLFIEKPVAMEMTTAKAMLETLDDTGIITMGACNFRFDPRLKAIGEPTTLVLEMGQNWRYWSDLHQPVTLMMDDIHELDLAHHLAGPIVGVSGCSTLRRADALVKHANGSRSHIHLNRVSDPPHRTVTSYEGHGRIVASLWPTDPEVYRLEMEHFLACVEDVSPTCNPLASAVETLGWALEVVG